MFSTNLVLFTIHQQGLIIGQAITGAGSVIFSSFRRCVRPHRQETDEEMANRLRREKVNNQGVTADDESENDPDGGGQTDKKTDLPLFMLKSKRNLEVPTFEVLQEAEQPADRNVTTYTPTKESGTSSVRLRPMNAGQLVPVDEDDTAANGETSATPTLVQVQMDKVAEEGIEISDTKNAQALEDHV